MIFPSQRFRERIDNLEWKAVKPPPHIVQLDCILLVYSLKATRTAIVDGVAEILVVLHNHNNLVCSEGGKLPPFRLRYKYSPRTLCRLRSSNLLVPTALLVPLHRLPNTRTPAGKP